MIDVLRCSFFIVILRRKNTVMELRQLKYFIKVAETLNFSAAAKELFVTQSAIAQQIMRLEQELEQPLFERNSRQVLLTEAGRLLLPLAIKTVNNSQECKQQLNDLKDMKTGELNIGVTYSFSSVVSETMLDFFKMYPGIKINVMYTHMSRLIDELLKHNLDIALAFRPSDTNPNIDSQVLFNSHLAAIVNEYHPLADKKSVTLSELSRYNLALPSRGLQARNAFEDIVAGKDYSFHIKVEINNIHMLFRLIRNTQFATVLSESTVINEQGVRAVKIDEPGNVMVGCIHTLKDAYLKDSAKEFIRMLRHSTALLHNDV